MSGHGFKIHPSAHIGTVSLTVSDLGRSEEFYVDVLGLTSTRLDADSLTFSTKEHRRLITVHEVPGATAARRATGLFHLALLFPSRIDLARAVLRLVQKRFRIQGSADHLVSEAVYLADPDGNGIELYRDRPRGEWRFDGAQVRMANDPFDLQALIGELDGVESPWEGAPAGVSVGHLHLKVADIASSVAFYRDVLGLDVMLEWGADAAFLSAGGYHHHLGINTWSGVGNPPPPPDAVGLRHYELFVPDEGELSRLTERLEAAGVVGERTVDGYLVADPSQNGVLITAAGSG